MSDPREENARLDANLRQTLDAGAASAERIVRAALAGAGEVGSRPRRLRAWLAVAALLAAGLILALWLARSPEAHPVQTAGGGGAFQITNHGEVLTVRHPGGQIWLRRGVADEARGTGPRLVILKGDSDD